MRSDELCEESGTRGEGGAQGGARGRKAAAEEL